MNYTVGFIFDEAFENILLIRKNKPEWQAGRLNGVGGKQEPGERRARQTMARECREECGLEIGPDEWTMFAEAILIHQESRVAFFFTTVPDLSAARAMTDEEIEIHPVSAIIDGGLGVIPNLQFLIPLAVNWGAYSSEYNQLDNVILMYKRPKK